MHVDGQVAAAILTSAAGIIAAILGARRWAKKASLTARDSDFNMGIQMRKELRDENARLRECVEELNKELATAEALAKDLANQLSEASRSRTDSMNRRGLPE